MSTVVIYTFTGRFTGEAEYEYEPPALHAKHKCLLFVAQASSEGEYERAMSEAAKYGFAEIEFSRHGVVQPEMLNAEQFRGFSGLYEEALELGSSLVYYPNA